MTVYTLVIVISWECNALIICEKRCFVTYIYPITRYRFRFTQVFRILWIFICWMSNRRIYLIRLFFTRERYDLLSNNLLSKHLNEFARTQKAKELVANNSIEGIAEKDCATQCREYIKSPHYRRRLFIERDVDTRREEEESGRVSRRPAERIQELAYEIKNHLYKLKASSSISLF